MREVGPARHLTRLKQHSPYIIHDHLLLLPEELEKRIPLAAQANNCAELEELQELLHFPEEVALRLADTEYQLFYQVPPIEYLRQVTLDLGGAPADTLPGNRTTVSALIKRFNEVSAWITQLIISQPTHDTRKAVLSCVLRVALSSWNIGNFNGAMEIVAGLKSNKLKPFWLSITEKESLPVLDFLSAALLSAEYDRALSRALAMSECRVVPFFGAFLRELRDILASASSLVTLERDSGSGPPGSGDSQQQQQRQVFISDFNGEDHYFTRIGPGGLINLDKIYRTQAVMDHISLFHQHYHSRNRVAPATTVLDYLKSVALVSESHRAVRQQMPEKLELDAEYEIEVDAYHPVQPLPYDHGVSFVSMLSPHTKVDQHIIQILHHGSTVVIWEGLDSPAPATSPSKGIIFYMRLDRSCSVVTWVRPSWSALKAGDSESGTPDYNLSFNPEETLLPGLLTKLTLQSSGENSTGTALDDGFLDLTTIKEVTIGTRDVEKEQEFTQACKRFGIDSFNNKDCCLTILHGNGISDNRFLYMVCPPVLCRLWFTGLCWLIRVHGRQKTLSDRRLLWLREQYMQLYHEEGYCCGPLAADAIRAFGGRDWSLAGAPQAGAPPGEPSSTLRREVSMKIKKKQILSNQAFKDRSLRSQFVEPVTMCMESSYWRNPTQHRQSTPTFMEHQPDVARHHSLGHLACTVQPKMERLSLARERHGSAEHLWHGRHPRVGSILYDTQLDFVDFVYLFRSFSLLIRKDLRDLFEQLAISYRSVAVNSSAKVNGVKINPNAAKKPNKLGLITRNTRQELEGLAVNSQKKIYDAIAAASIFTNCAGIDTNNSQVITQSTFAKFLETRQMEVWSEEDVKMLIQRHEPDPLLRSQHCLSFEGFARYLMDKDNYAFVSERQVPDDAAMNRPMSHYYVASSHNTYLTGHQLKGESSVELYGQVLLTGCRCVELDCWDGDDGNPMIYHGHTFTTKIPFASVVEAIERNAFVTSPYPVILSIENHCSLPQQARMAHTFRKVFGDKLVSGFIFDNDLSDDPVLPSPSQLRHRILIKNKKLSVDAPPPTGTPARIIRYSVPGRTSSIISNASSSSFNDDFSDDDFDDDDDDLDNIDDKPPQGLVTDSPRPSYSAASKTSSTKRPGQPPEDKIKKRSSQINKELSDMVLYVQAIKFRGLNPQNKQNDPETKRPDPSLPCYQCSSVNENTAKKLCRKQPLALLAHTQTQLVRAYPAGMRIDSSNFNPVIFWAFGIQMSALNYQTDDAYAQLNSALFESNGKCGYVPKPGVMWDRSHVMYKRFNPWDKQFDGLHSLQLVISVVSGQYVGGGSGAGVSTVVEVELVGIPVDCSKQRTRVAHRNGLNPVWNDTFVFRVLFQELAFLRFTVVDAGTNHVLLQRALPLKYLRPGYRHLRLRGVNNRPSPVGTLFIYSRAEEESVEEDRSQPEATEASSMPTQQVDSTYVGLSGAPVLVKRRMFFLMVHGVVSDEPYTILKITQESTTREVLLQALARGGLPAERVNDHILIEEVAQGWEKKDHDLPATRRILDPEERPLQAQARWRGEGRFVLKRMGDDPSSRAWLSSIRSVAQRERRADSDAGAWDDSDTFLVCVYNVSPDIPYAILKVPLAACAQDVLAHALVKARRLEHPQNFVLVEELEWGGSAHNLQQRALADDENVYKTQASWQTIGRFILHERAHATPAAFRKNRSLRLAALDRISRGIRSAKPPVQSALSDPSRPPDGRRTSREVHSEGEALSDDDRKDSDLLATVQRLKKVSLKKFKEWKS